MIRWRLLGLLLVASTRFADAALPASVGQALRSAAIPQRSVAMVVMPAVGGAPIVEHNADLPMNPASVMKLLTTYAALEILGPTHVWRTEALVTTAPDDGRLADNLYLRGSGDPKLSLEQFWLLLREIRLRGVRHIDGDLIVDRGAFQLPAHDPAAFDQEPLRPYNAGPDALLVNFAALRFIVGVGADGKSIRVLQRSPDARIQIDNRLQLAAGECGDWREALTPRFEGWRLILDGRFAAQCGEKELNLSPTGGDAQLEGLFGALWAELGGTLKGRLRSDSTPPSAGVLAYHDSPSLAEIVRDTNKFSNNVMARQLLIALSPPDPANPASPELGEKRLRQWLAEKNLSMPELVIENGAGLSRRERVSAGNLARLLAAAWQSPVMPEFISSLPILGRDGTLRRRLDQSAASGRGHFKTGYLDNTRALAGYQIDSGGRRWIVVALVNDANARGAKPAIDALIDWVAAR